MGNYKPCYNEKHRMLGLLPVLAEYTSNTSEPDYILAGKYGCIWRYDDTRYFVMVDSAIIANRYLDFSKEDKLKGGEEHGMIVDEAQAYRWLKLLKIPNNRNSQIKYIESRS